MTDFARARANMVNGQLETNGISQVDLLEAYTNSPREKLVDAVFASRVYVDDDHVLPNGQYVLQPLVEATLLQAALYAGEALNDSWGGEYGVGNALYLGVNALPGLAVLAYLSEHVHVIEPDSAALATALERLKAVGITNVTGHVGTCAEGLADEAPFDAIVLPGASTYIPDMLLDQLSMNGRFVCVLRTHPRDVGRTVCITRMDDEHLSSHFIADAHAPYAPEFAPQPEFTF